MGVSIFVRWQSVSKKKKIRSMVKCRLCTGHTFVNKTNKNEVLRAWLNIIIRYVCLDMFFFSISLCNVQNIYLNITSTNIYLHLCLSLWKKKMSDNFWNLHIYTYNAFSNIICDVIANTTIRGKYSSACLVLLFYQFILYLFV